jgi:hypothetical protein
VVDQRYLDVVDVAFEHPFLLHGLLAMAAVHKTTQASQSERPALLAQADAHMSSCLTPYKKHLAHPTLEASLPMFLLSSVLVTYNLASARVQEPDDPIEALLHCFRLLRGVRVVIGTYWFELKQMPIVENLMGAVLRIEENPSAEHERVEEVMALKELITPLVLSDAEACTSAVDGLQEIYLQTEKAEVLENRHSICMMW